MGGIEGDDRIDITGIELNWDPRKVIKNLKKHKVMFDEAIAVFGDKRLVDFPDKEHSEDEFRYIAIGRTETGVLLFVNFATRREAIRIISASSAEP